MSSTRPQSPAGQAGNQPSYHHVHFGAGRLGLGLVAPFFRKPGVETWILNRAVGGARATGETALSSARRNELLMDHPDRLYKVGKQGVAAADAERVGYDAFVTYTQDDIEETAQRIARAAADKGTPVVLTASILKPEHYKPVVKVLDVLGSGPTAGPIFFIACENTVSAHDILSHTLHSEAISPAARDRITGVHALVDRVCVGMEEDSSEAHSTVRVLAEDYGSLKLERNDQTEELAELAGGSRVEFSRYVDTEKQIKSWLLNGSHWLIALAAYEGAQADRNIKLNEYLALRPEHAEFAATVMAEMSEGIAILLRSDPQYAAFQRDIDVDAYLAGCRRGILDRFLANEDPLSRILARFQAPSAEAFTSLQSFIKRFSDRVDAPMRAYEDVNGVPPAASHSFQSLFRLVAEGSYIDSAPK